MLRQSIHLLLTEDANDGMNFARRSLQPLKKSSQWCIVDNDDDRVTSEFTFIFLFFTITTTEQIWKWEIQFTAICITESFRQDVTFSFRCFSSIHAYVKQQKPHQICQKNWNKNRLKHGWTFFCHLPPLRGKLVYRVPSKQKKKRSNIFVIQWQLFIDQHES